MSQKYGITLDRTSHTYLRGNTVVPGVTRIIEAILSPMPKVNAELMRNKAELGTLVHDACILDAQGELDHETIDPEALPYMRAFWRFREETRATILSSAEIVYNDLYDYAGEIDHGIRFINGSDDIVDLKTGVKMKSHEIQLAAYKAAKEQSGDRVGRTWTLYLGADGFYKLIEVGTVPGDFQIFLSALRCYRWRIKNGT